MQVQTTTDRPLTTSEASDVPTYANLWDMVNGRSMRDDSPDACESLDWSLSLDLTID